MALASDVDDSEALFWPHSLPSSVWSPEPELFRQLSGFPESVIGVMRPSSYKAIISSSPDTAFYTSCKDSIALPVLSSTCQSPGSRSELVPLVNAPEGLDAFVWTDIHIIIYEVDSKQGVTPNAYLAKDAFWFIALCMCGSSLRRDYQETQRRVIYWAGFKGDFKGKFSLVGNLRIEQSSRAFGHQIHWSSFLSTLIASHYTSTPVFKILIDFGCYFGTCFRRHYLNFLPSGWQAKSMFSFLRYYGPKLLRGARRILLDEDGFQIIHIGQGAFAVISRVWHRPSGEVRVMKRITFDKTGLAEYLARNEIETLEAMKGNIWFPPLLNHFKEGGEFVVTMVSPPLPGNF